jgi:hypothetical protein
MGSFALTKLTEIHWKLDDNCCLVVNIEQILYVWKKYGWFIEGVLRCMPLLCEMPTRDLLPCKTKNTCLIFNFGWQISIITTMFTNNALYYVHTTLIP